MAEENNPDQGSRNVSKQKSEFSVSLTEPTKTMYIVGNGIIEKDMGSIIDSADVVIRFNDLNNYNLNTGTKISIWVISSNSFLIDKRINAADANVGDLKIKTKDIIQRTKSIYFSIPPFSPTQAEAKGNLFRRITRDDKNDRISSVERFLAHFEAFDHPHRIIEFSSKYVKSLAPELWPPNWTCPSNGYLITRMLLDDPTFYKYKKHLVGFSWEGWPGHPWFMEKLYIEKLERDNLINIVK